ANLRPQSISAADERRNRAAERNSGRLFGDRNHDRLASPAAEGARSAVSTESGSDRVLPSINSRHQDNPVATALGADTRRAGKKHTAETSAARRFLKPYLQSSSDVRVVYSRRLKNQPIAARSSTNRR